MRIATMFLAIFFLLPFACGGPAGPDDGGNDDPAVTFPAEIDGTSMGSVASLEIAVTPGVERIELWAGNVLLAEIAVSAGATTVILNWDTTSLDDGDVELFLKAKLAGGEDFVSAPFSVTIDNTPPLALIGSEVAWLEIYESDVTVTLDVDEANLASLVIRDDFENELLSTTEVPSMFKWTMSDTDPNGLHNLRLTVTDLAGNTTQSNTQTFVLSRPDGLPTVEYDRSPFQLNITGDYLTTETHIKGWATTQDNIKQVISWIRWNSNTIWELKYSVGQGICPHRGIEYKSASGNDGELFVNLTREMLSSSIENSLPLSNQGSDVFPNNGDPLTLGSFFGHVAALDEGAHVGETLPVEMHFVFVYAD